MKVWVRVGRRFLYLALVLLGISFITFGMSLVAPGDPAEILLRDRGEDPSPERVASLSRELGLEGSFIRQYLGWLGRTVQGDLGRSWRTGEPVSRELVDRLPATVELALTTFAFVVVLSAFTGLVGAIRQNRAVDRIGQAWAILCLSIPNFWLGTLLIFLFSLKLHWFPILGRGSATHLVLPVLTLGLSVAAMQGRVLRASMVEILGQDYIRFALAKGLRPWGIVRRHLLKNALPPLVTLWGISLGHLLGGAFIVESIFSWPGLGKLTVEAVLGRDLPVVQGAVLFMALIFVGVNQGIDLILGLLDPRVRAGTVSKEGSFLG